MNRKKAIVTINVILIIAYLIVASTVIFMYSKFPSQYREVESKYIEEIQTKLNEALSLEETQMLKKIEDIKEEYPLEIIIEKQGVSLYRSLNLAPSNSYLGTLSSDNVLYEMQGYMEGQNPPYFVWCAVYHLTNDHYLLDFINQQNTLFIIAFAILIVTLIIANYFFIRPLFRLSESVQKASAYQFEDIQVRKSDDNINKDFVQFVNKLKGSISVVSRKYTELESQLRYERERLTNVITISKALVHDLKSSVHQVMVESEYGKENLSDEEKFAKEILENNIEKSESIILEINEILKLMNNNFNVEVEKEKFDLVQMTFEMAKLFNYSMKEKDVYFLLEAPETLEVYTNKVNLKLLVHNIISNACIYAKASSEIVFEIEYQNNTLYINCTNESEAHNIERMMNSQQLFNAVEEHNSDNPYSSGNGLFLIKDLVTMFEGEYHLSTNKNTVKMMIKIPLKEGDVYE